MKFGIALPNGWKMSLVGINDPIEAYETMTKVPAPSLHPRIHSRLSIRKEK